MSDSEEDREEYIYVLDYLPGGHSEDRVSDEALAQGVGDTNFSLLEVVPQEEVDVKIGDFLYIGNEEGEDDIKMVKSRLDYGDLTQNAKSELEYGINAVIDRDEERFVDFFNNAGSVTIRMHQLDLLPGIGEKIRNSILDERKYEEFSDFEDLEERIDGLHDPKSVLVERIIEEIKDLDVKYKLFAVG